MLSMALSAFFWALLQAGSPSLTASSAEIIADEPLPEPNRAELVVEVINAAAAQPPAPLPVRVIVTASDGSHPDGSGQGVYADGRFFAEGRFTVQLPPGETRLLVRSGPNYVPLDFKCTVAAGRRTGVRAKLHRWFAPEERGWYSGDNHVHAQHDAKATVKTSLAYTALQARANGLSYVTEAGSEISYQDLDRLDTKTFLFRYAPELRPGPYVGHLNTPGIRQPIPKERYEQFAQRPLPVQALVEAVHELGGVVIHTHPLTPPHQLHWMGATEAYSDAVLGRCPDALDIDSRATELFWFAILNLGNRVGCSSYTDCALGRLQTPSPGDRRVYCHAKELSYLAVVEALRQGRTVATNGGPIFPFLTIEGHEPGATLQLKDKKAVAAQVEVHTLYPLKSAQLICRGQVIKTFDVRGKQGKTHLQHELDVPHPERAWYVCRAEDERGNWAITGPIYIEPAQPQSSRSASALLLEISNHTRFAELRRDFFAHLIVTLSVEDTLQEVQLLKDGQVMQSFKPEAGNQVHDGKVPVIGLGGDYRPGWIWHREGKKTVHLQADWPVQESGWYGLRAVTQGGCTLSSDAVHFDAEALSSHTLSVAHLRGPDTRFTLWGYGEEMPLADIRLPFLGDHWWYPQKPFWRLTATFGDQPAEVTGGGNQDGARHFRP